MKQIQYRGFKAFVDRMAKDSSHGSRVLMISLFGTLGNARAIASGLVLRESRKWNSGISVGNARFHLDENVSYSTITQRSEKRSFGIPTRETLIHELCTVKRLDSPFFYVLSPVKLENLDENFCERLRIASHLAVQSADHDWLWETAQEEVKFLSTNRKWTQTDQLIKEIEGYNCYAYWVNARTEIMAQVLRKHFGLCIRPTLRRDESGARRVLVDDPRFPDFHFSTEGRSITITHKDKVLTTTTRSYHEELAEGLEKAGLQAGLWVLPEAA